MLGEVVLKRDMQRGRKGVKTKKNLNVEALRIIAMFLIVSCHGTLHIPWLLNVDKQMIYPAGWKAAGEYLIVQYGQVGVSLFFIISGYFLVTKKFSWLRIFSTWFQMICYTSLTLLVVFIIFRTMQIPTEISLLLQKPELTNTLFWTFFPFSYGSYWFITAYISLLLLIPYLNCLFDNLSEKYIKILILLLTIFGSWVLFFGRVNPWNNVVYAILGYLIGGWIRKYYPSSKYHISNITGCLLITLFTVSMLIFNYFAASGSHLSDMMGWKNQVKPGIQILPMIIAGIIFILFLRLDFHPLPNFLKSIIQYTASATFGVYLLHENMFIYRVFWPMLTSFFPNPQNRMQMPLEAISIFVIAFVILTVVSAFIDIFIIHPLKGKIIKKFENQ